MNTILAQIVALRARKTQLTDELMSVDEQLADLYQLQVAYETAYSAIHELLDAFCAVGNPELTSVRWEF